MIIACKYTKKHKRFHDQIQKMRIIRY